MFKIITFNRFGKLAIAAAISLASSVPALAWEYSDFIVMSGPKLTQVAYAPSSGATAPDYSTFPFWAGAFDYSFGMGVFGERIPQGFSWPDDMLVKMSVKDAYGKYIRDVDYSEDVKKMLQDALETDSVLYAQHTNLNIELGGKYIFNAYFNIMDWDKEIIQEIYDPASVRVYGEPQPRLGANADFNVYFNTGYPYDIASFTGNENVNYRFEYTAPKGTESVLITSGNVPLNFAQSTTPLLAVRDSLHLFVEKPQIGYYRLFIDSDTWPEGNSNFTFTVGDTVRADATIDREVIDLDVDSEINTSAWVNYGFPYIPVVKPDNDTTEYDTIPTVRFITTLKYSANPDLAISDTVAIVDEAFADNDIDLSRNMKIRLDEIKRDSLSRYTPFVNVEVSFNGKAVFDKNFPLTIVNTPSAIEEISATLPESRRGIYNIMGMKIDVPFEQLPSGIYIVDGKKVAKR